MICLTNSIIFTPNRAGQQMILDIPILFYLSTPTKARGDPRLNQVFVLVTVVILTTLSVGSVVVAHEVQGKSKTRRVVTYISNVNEGMHTVIICPFLKTKQVGDCKKANLAKLFDPDNPDGLITGPTISIKTSKTIIHNNYNICILQIDCNYISQDEDNRSFYYVDLDASGAP
jgi:hypothetical protein